MRKVIALICFISILSSCSSSDSQEGNEELFDVSEGQTNWAKFGYQELQEEKKSGDGIGVNDIAIVGEKVIMVGAEQFGEISGTIWRSNDSGKTWEIVGGAGGCGAGSEVYDVYMLSKDVIFAYGDCGGSQVDLIKSIDGGDSWETLSLPRVFGEQTRRPLHFFDESTGIFTNYKTTDGGNTWNIMPDLADFVGANKIFSIFFLDNQIGYCSSQTTILKTENGGNNWFIIHEDLDESFQDLYFIDSNIGFLTTDRELMKTLDGGLTWSPVLSRVIRDISFATDEIGFAAGLGGIFKTIDGGNTWNLNYETSFITLEQCCGEYFKTNGFNAIAFDGLNFGIAAGFQNIVVDQDNLINNKAYIARTSTAGE